MKFSYLSATFLSLMVPASGLKKSTSLDEPFQDSFKNLKHSPCVTLYHRNGRVGCGSVDRDTQTGPLFFFDGSQSLPEGRSFVAVIEEYDLTADNMVSLLNANTYNNLKGILVLNSTSSNDSNEYGSPGSTYPQGYNTPSAGVSYGNNQFPWNGNGDGLNNFDMYGVPMVYVNEEDASYYVRMSSQNKNKAVKIYTDFNYYMGPDGVKSADCLAWKDAADDNWNPKCLPLGGTSVWAFAGSPPKSKYGNSQQQANDAAEDDNGRKLEDAGNNNGGQKPAVIIGTSIDSTSLFHDLAPGANEGASNTLALIMAAYLIGQNVDDATLDGLNNRIVFGFFEGEAYGYLGSRSFLRDILNFNCPSDYLVNSVFNDQNSEKACLWPLRPSLKFRDIGQIAGMLTVDQVGVPAGDGHLYIHNDGQGGIGTFMAYVAKNVGTNNYIVAESAAGENADQYPYPPTPLTALQSLTDGAYGGAVLTGYDYAYTKRPPYQSHLNWYKNAEMDLEAIASAATILARTALAAAYDDGSFDYETAAQYANNAISELSYDNEVLVELADCLFVDGNCDMLSKYASMDAKNEKHRTGFDIQAGYSLGSPPNYYTGVYRIDSGQPFVRVGDNVYGAYNGDKYGKKKSDAVGVQPKMLEQALRNMLNDYLGRGSFSSDDGNYVSPRSCKKESDCSGVSYCSSAADSATCSASKMCVCKRAFFHHALDEAVVPAVNNYTGFFIPNSNEQGVSPLYTEPYWSSSVGVKMYRVANSNPGYITIVAGAIVLGGSFFLAIIIKVGMKKQKMY